jgi:hypothetical protein
LFANTTGYFNTATGYGALNFNTIGSKNTAMGMGALLANTEGLENSAFGALALYLNTGGYRNTAIGYKTLENNSIGSNSVAIGQEALNTNTTGSSNTACGSSSLYNNSTGSSNTAIGGGSLVQNTTGNFNTAGGLSALGSNTSGYSNTAFGKDALWYNSTGNSNVALGYKAGYWETESNRLYIDNTSRGNQSDARSKALIYGEFNADPAVQKLVLNAKVGIGTLNPTHTLSVNGEIRAKEVIVNTGWSDFVFLPDYELISIPSLESFIRTHGHLPDIPDASQVEKEGVSIGKMDAKLLQKIEELTLYVIELNKRIGVLECENQNLRKQSGQISESK